MSTRSLISIRNDQGTFDAVYCHFDGYPSGVGETLRRNYTTKESVNELISKGDMSFLEHTLDKSEFYTKRGEPLRVRRNLSHKELVEKAHNMTAEYLYTFEDGRWSYISL